MSNEWYTPPELMEFAHRVLGKIDLDPASSELANVIVGAERFLYYPHGLVLPWNGTVWLNPPYNDPVGDWINKLLSEFKAGRVKEALLLVQAHPDTEWWNSLRNLPVCFIRGRLRFLRMSPEGILERPTSPSFASAVFYLGDFKGRFRYTFFEIGHVYEPVGIVDYPPKILRPQEVP